MLSCTSPARPPALSLSLLDQSVNFSSEDVTKRQYSNLMLQSKQRASTGFRKGFLLSSTKKSKKKSARPKVSSALLDVEGKENPLLFVNENDTAFETRKTASVPQKPLQVIISEEGDDDNNDFGLTEVSTTRRRLTPLIGEVCSAGDSPIDGISDPSSSLQPKNERPLLWEVPSYEMKVTNRSQGDIVSDSKERSPLVTDEKLSAGTPSDEQTSPTIMTSPHLVHELTSIQWKLRQRQSMNDEHQQVKQFVSQNIQSGADWAFVWNFILNAIAEDVSNRMTPSIRLGIVLLQETDGLGSFVPFLIPTDDKHSRVLALGGAKLINCYCQSMRETKTSIMNKVWMTQVVPLLSKIVLASTTKRSVLSQQCITAAYEILAAVSEQKDGIVLLNLKSTLWNVISIIDELLEVQCGWGEKSLSSSQCSIANYSVDASRKKCSYAVLNDWRLVIKEALRLREATLVDGEGESDEALARLTEYTCLQVTGVSSDGIELPGLGGLHQTLSNDPPKITAEQIILCMQGGAQLLQSIREKKESEEVQSWQNERLRAIVRGVAAWLGQSKRHLQSLSKQSVTSDGSFSGNTNLRQATDLSMIMLRCDTEESITLVLAIL